MYFMNVQHMLYFSFSIAKSKIKQYFLGIFYKTLPIIPETSEARKVSSSTHSTQLKSESHFCCFCYFIIKQIKRKFKNIAKIDVKSTKCVRSDR